MSTHPDFLHPDLAALAWEQPASIWRGVLRADHMAWRDVQELQAIQTALAETTACGPLAREAFLGLYAATPGLADAPPDTLRVLHQLFARAGQLPEWQGLRAGIDDDPVAAAFGAAHFALELRQHLPEAVKAALDASAQAAAAALQAEEQRQQLEALLEGMPAASAPPALAAQLASLGQQTAQARATAQQAAAAAEEALAAAAARTTRALAQALRGADQELAGLKTAARAFGAPWGTGRGAGARAQIDALQQLAAALSQDPMLRQLLEELGWARRMLAEQLRQAMQGRESFTHYQVGELQPEDLAPAEWLGLLLGDPTAPLALDFLARALDDDLLHRRYTGQEAAGQGPLVFVRDTSGSMQSPPRKNALAAAVELALMQWALAAQRRFIAIPFSGPGQFTVYDPGPHPDLPDLLAHLTFGYWAGTEPYAPLQAAIQRIQTDPTLRQGDILILTDGAFAAPPADVLARLAAARANPGLRLVAVVIGDRPGAADFADRVVLINDLDKERDRLADAIRVLVAP